MPNVENDAPSQRGFLDATTGRQPHRCDLPKPFDIVFDGGPSGIFANGKPRLVLPGPVGSRWHCGGCPAVYVLTYHRGAPGQGSGYEWDLETRRQCRERLGLRWWQRREGVTR